MTRIVEIISDLENRSKTNVKNLPPEKKLQALCEALLMSPEMLDRLILDNAPVLRTVKGHAFESFFDFLLRSNGFNVVEMGGDNAVDRLVNKKSLQLKTSTEAGSRGPLVQFKTHKTHGAKSEQESIDYYHRADHFADFLIGLVSYEPLRILVLSKAELPRHPKSQSHILSPFSVEWPDHPALNAFDRIGIHPRKLLKSEAPRIEELLPHTARRLGLSSDIILNTILSRANFRIWDMAIRGFAIETIFKDFARRNGVALLSPHTDKNRRADKADFAVHMDNSIKLLQMKGISTSNCDFDVSDPIIGTETQLTRGRNNDHETQSRLYLRSDFDYLVLGLLPGIVRQCREAARIESNFAWEFFLIPTSDLRSHHRYPHRLASLQKFRYSALRRYKIDDWREAFA